MHNSTCEKREGVPKQWKDSEFGQRIQGAYRRTGPRRGVRVLGVDEGEHSGFMYQEYSSRCGLTLERAEF